jgi:hypothetical protein
MRERPAFYPDCRATGRARMVNVFVASRGQHTPVRATESYKTFIAWWKFVRGEQLVEGTKR